MASSLLRRHRVSAVRFRSARRSSPCCTSAPSVPSSDGEGLASRAVCKKGMWFFLPPFEPPVDAASVGKEIATGRRLPERTRTPTTALKWVRRCCPNLPVSLVQKVFRLRQVRREMMNSDTSEHALKRVSKRELLKSGDLILLPVTLKEFPQGKTDYCFNKQQINYVRSLELYKDEAVIAVNKPPGMPVQGGFGIKLSMDILAGTCLRYHLPEPPRMVHRLDRECSGILVFGRTQTSATILHSIFREKTYRAFDDLRNDKMIFRKKYWALVIGHPKHSEGLVTAPLRKAVLENGKSERIMVTNNEGGTSQHALTEYRVIESTHGFTWLELGPLTGRKHQLRVHCAEVLGTPIVGDYKYGWSDHKRWRPLCPRNRAMEMERATCPPPPPLGLNLEGGSILEEEPRLHLHCQQMLLPNISLVLKHMESSTGCHDFSELECLELVAPLPLHMKRSWDALNYTGRMAELCGNISVG